MIKKCEKCKRKRLIEAKGLCSSCYTYSQIMKNKKTKKRHYERTKKWNKENREYYRNYQREKLNIPEERWRKS